MLTDFRLTVFKTVAHQLSYTRAAAVLHITQPAVSKHINELEKQLAVALFLRKGNTITLTAHGERLLKHTHKILEYYKQLNDDFSTDNEPTNGTIAIGASTTIAQYVLPAVLARFKQRYPNVKVTLLNGNSVQVENWIMNEQIDIGLIEGDTYIPNLHYDILKDDKIILVTASPKNNAVTQIDIQRLKYLPLVLREDGSGTLDVIDSALAKHNIYRKDLNVIIQLGSTESIKRYLYNSDAYALTSITAVDNELKAELLRPIDIEGVTISRTFRFVSNHGQYNRLVSIFKSFCVENASL